MAAVVAMLVGAGCGGGGGESVANPRDPVRAMLRQRADALNAGDVDGWLRPVAAEARRFEEQVGRGALAAEVARVDLHLGRADVDQQGTRFETASVELVYRYKGLPEDNVFRMYLLADIELRDGAWVVTSSRPDTKTPPPVWSTGAVETARSPHFLALFRPGVPAVAGVLETAERSRARLLPRLTLVPDEQHLVVLAGDDAQYTSMGGAPGTLAFAGKLLRAPSGAVLDRPENREMVVNLAALDDPDAIARLDGRADALHGLVFEHELGHLALSRFDREQTPVWVKEAGAMLLAEERRVHTWKTIVDGDLFGGAELSFGPMSGQPEITGIQYAYANAGALYLAEAFGPEKFWDFYQNFKALGRTVRDIPTVRADGAQRLVRRYYGFDLDELDTRTREWMRKAVESR